MEGNLPGFVWYRSMRWYFNEIFGPFLKDRSYVLYSLLVNLARSDYIGNEMGR